MSKETKGKEEHNVSDITNIENNLNPTRIIKRNITGLSQETLNLFDANRELAKKLQNLTTPTSKLMKALEASATGQGLAKKLENNNITASKALENSINCIRPNIFDSDLAKVNRAFTIPENPAHKTNKKLDEVINAQKQLVTLQSEYISQSSKLLSSLNESIAEASKDSVINGQKAYRQNSIMLFIAMISLLLTTIFSYLGYEPTKKDITIKDLNSNISKVINENNNLQKLEIEQNKLLNKKIDILIREQKINLNMDKAKLPNKEVLQKSLKRI